MGSAHDMPPLSVSCAVIARFLGDGMQRFVVNEECRRTQSEPHRKSKRGNKLILDRDQRETL